MLENWLLTPFICGCSVFNLVRAVTKFSAVLPFLGDMEAARSNAKGACGLNIAGMVICLSVVTIFLVMYLG